MNLLFSINRTFIPLWEQCMATILRHGGAAHYALYVLGKPKPWQKTYIGPLGVFYQEELALTRAAAEEA